MGSIYVSKVLIVVLEKNANQEILYCKSHDAGGVIFGWGVKNPGMPHTLIEILLIP